MSKILIIDDDEGARSELIERVESLAHEHVCAECVDNAWKLIEQESFDCILLDLAIPMKFEGVARADHGKNLLQRIVALEGAPPVIVVTANSSPGHKVGIECMELGAASFVSKDYDGDPVGPKIRMVLEGKLAKRPKKQVACPEFKGGVLVLNEDCIEINGIVVGGVKGHAYIRRVIETLAGRKNGHYQKYSAKKLAESIGPQTSPQSVSSAIMEFRDNCENKLGCGDHDVIKTCAGGGYQLGDRIEVKLGRDESPKTQADSDRAKVLTQIKKKDARTRRQISDASGIPVLRVRRALSTLEDQKVIRHEGSGSNLHYFLV